LLNRSSAMSAVSREEWISISSMSFAPIMVTLHQ
jgi:hypothetical protein